MNPNQPIGGDQPNQDNQPWVSSPVAEQQAPFAQPQQAQPSDFRPVIAGGGSAGVYDEVQSTMRKTILKIIAIMSGVSILGVSGIFLLTNASDSGITDRVNVENSLATYEVPTTWKEDTREGATTFLDGETNESSRANIVVVEPFKLTFDSKLISQSQADSVADEYEEAIVGAEVGFELVESSKIDIEGFEYGYEFKLSGTASDGITELIGISHLLIDASNNLHSIEFLAVASYWNSNEAEILKIVNSYQLKED